MCCFFLSLTYFSAVKV
uniref:Uncharacterized protein n=1 Tax=Arundo donax TaxID=35708 RepID=A0A0A9HKB7_ARUDO